MTKDQILAVIEEILRDILPELESTPIDPRHSMKDLGANSIDRADVVLEAMETLKVSFPLNELAGVDNIQGLVDFLHDRMHAAPLPPG